MRTQEENLKSYQWLIRVNRAIYQFQGSIYFDTEELAQKAIDEIGEERLKKYVFRVEE